MAPLLSLASKRRPGRPRKSDSDHRIGSPNLQEGSGSASRSTSPESENSKSPADDDFNIPPSTSQDIPEEGSSRRPLRNAGVVAAKVIKAVTSSFRRAPKRERSSRSVTPQFRRERMLGRQDLLTAIRKSPKVPIRGLKEITCSHKDGMLVLFNVGSNTAESKRLVNSVGAIRDATAFVQAESDDDLFKNNNLETHYPAGHGKTKRGLHGVAPPNRGVKRGRGKETAQTQTAKKAKQSSDEVPAHVSETIENSMSDATGGEPAIKEDTKTASAISVKKTRRAGAKLPKGRQPSSKSTSKVQNAARETSRNNANNCSKTDANLKDVQSPSLIAETFDPYLPNVVAELANNNERPLSSQHQTITKSRSEPPSNSLVFNSTVGEIAGQKSNERNLSSKSVPPSSVGWTLLDKAGHDSTGIQRPNSIGRNGAIAAGTLSVPNTSASFVTRHASNRSRSQSRQLERHKTLSSIREKKEVNGKKDPDNTHVLEQIESQSPLSGSGLGHGNSSAEILEEDEQEVRTGICPICKAELSQYSLQESREHVERCMDDDDEANSLLGETTNSSVDSYEDQERLVHLENKLFQEGLMPAAYEADGQAATQNSAEGAKYKAITDQDEFQNALQNPEQRSVHELYMIAGNVATALDSWQKEWMELESRAAPIEGKVPRKPREQLNPQVLEDQKEAALYGYVWNSHPSKIGNQAPWQRAPQDAAVGRMVGGRELRQRKVLAKQDEFDEEEGSPPPAKRRGRPPKVVSPSNGTFNSGTVATRVGRRRVVNTISQETGQLEIQAPSDGPKKRGRPRLHHGPQQAPPLDSGLSFGSNEGVVRGSQDPVVVKRRGRPPKIAAAIAPAGLTRKRTAEDSEEGDEDKPNKRIKSAKKSAAMKAWWSNKKAIKASETPQTDESQIDEPRGRPIGGLDGAGDSPFEQVASSRDLTPLPRKKGRPPGSKGKRFSRISERIVDSTAEESDGGAVVRDGLTEYERFQRLANGDLMGTPRTRRRWHPVGMEDDEMETEETGGDSHEE
ncbi:MAG: hypothetical protein M4579_002981 [Chaenotheca gracillima]|nr:MAG: hypothetical protein M4579_002981 [Chaenotheca gracillima]